MFAVCARRTMAGARRLHVPPPPVVAAPSSPPPPSSEEVPKFEVLRSPAQTVIADVAAKHGVTVAEIMSVSKADKIVAARQEAIVQVHQTVRVGGEPIASKALGRIFHRDHSTILYTLRKAGLR